MVHNEYLISTVCVSAALKKSSFISQVTLHKKHVLMMAASYSTHTNQSYSEMSPCMAHPPPDFKRHIQLLVLIHATAEFRKASVLNTKDWLSKKCLHFLLENAAVHNSILHYGHHLQVSSSVVFKELVTNAVGTKQSYMCVRQNKHKKTTKTDTHL